MTNYLCVVYNGRNYHSFYEDKKNEIIKLIIDEYIIYKNYIKNVEKFLNMKRNDEWPLWLRDDIAGFLWVDAITYIEIKNDRVEVYENDEIIYSKKITNQKNPEFIEFINRRFLLKTICEKYNLPKDIHAYLINFF